MDSEFPLHFPHSEKIGVDMMVGGRDFRRHLYLELLPSFRLQMTYIIVNGDSNMENISDSLEFVVNKKKPDF